MRGRGKCKAIEFPSCLYPKPSLLEQFGGGNTIKYEPDVFNLEQTTIWSFPDRGNWATHSGKYRGNWSPYIPRNLILRYSSIGDWILDQFLGSGTTAIEAKLLQRNVIGVDINPSAIELAKSNLSFPSSSNSKVYVRQGNALKLSFIKDESIQLICTHPPYANIIPYSKDIQGDISLLRYDDFLVAMRSVASESYRILRKDGICAFMIGDIRQKGLVKPLGMNTMQLFIDAGFLLKEIVIKEQHNCRGTHYWAQRQNSFLLLAHEYIFIFQK